MTGVTVEYGADSESFTSLVGISVADATPIVRQFFGVPTDAELRVNGATAVTHYVLKDTDVVSFYKPSGTKGLTQ